MPARVRRDGRPATPRGLGRGRVRGMTARRLLSLVPALALSLVLALAGAIPLTGAGQGGADRSASDSTTQIAGLAPTASRLIVAVLPDLDDDALPPGSLILPAHPVAQDIPFTVQSGPATLSGRASPWPRGPPAVAS